MHIIVYIHICQIGEWKRSYQMIMDSIQQSGLHNTAHEIRCGVLTDITIDRRFAENDPKIHIIYEGRPAEYERPTLLHMRRSAESDPHDTQYLYCHTKGIRWFDTPQEPYIVDWIKFMIYWNIERWINATDILGKFDTYGCEYHDFSQLPRHYSGNFFWTTTYHLKTLTDFIGPEYNDPEFWLCSNGLLGGKPNVYNAFSSGLLGLDHYGIEIPEHAYR